MTGIGVPSPQIGVGGPPDATLIGGYLQSDLAGNAGRASLMAMAKFDVAVAGCGPGGLAAALLLHRDGHHVRLFERFDAPQPIGSGLMIQPTGRAVLRELGLDLQLANRSARIERLFGQAADRIVLDVRYATLASDTAFGLGAHRAALFDILFQAVRAAAIPIETGRTVTTSEMDGSRRRLRFADWTDQVDANNAPLRIVPGSHRLGRLSEAEVQGVVATSGERPCLAERGDVWLYATPIVHASLAADPPRRRRVLQVDYSADAAPHPLAWHGLWVAD